MGRPRNPECSDCGKPRPKTERAQKGWKGGRCPPCSRSYHTAAVRRHRARKSERERERDRVLAEARELGKMDPSDWGPMVNMNVHDTVAKGLPITATQAEQMREYGIEAGSPDADLESRVKQAAALLPDIPNAEAMLMMIAQVGPVE